MISTPSTQSPQPKTCNFFLAYPFPSYLSICLFIHSFIAFLILFSRKLQKNSFPFRVLDFFFPVFLKEYIKTGMHVNKFPWKKVGSGSAMLLVPVIKNEKRLHHYAWELEHSMSLLVSWGVSQVQFLPDLCNSSNDIGRNARNICPPRMKMLCCWIKSC